MIFVQVGVFSQVMCYLMRLGFRGVTHAKSNVTDLSGFYVLWVIKMGENENSLLELVDQLNDASVGFG